MLLARTPLLGHTISSVWPQAMQTAMAMVRLADQFRKSYSLSAILAYLPLHFVAHMSPVEFLFDMCLVLVTAFYFYCSCC